MKLRRCGLLFFVSLVACAPRATAPAEPGEARAEPAPRAMVDAKPVEWAKRATPALEWPANAESVALIITRGWDPDEHFAWLIANGSDVVAVYRANARELDDVIDQAMRTARTRVAGGGGVGGNSASFVMLGTIYVPGPKGPPHVIPGWPAQYLDDIYNAARGAHRETQRLQQKARASQH